MSRPIANSNSRLSRTERPERVVARGDRGRMLVFQSRNPLATSMTLPRAPQGAVPHPFARRLRLPLGLEVGVG